MTFACCRKKYTLQISNHFNAHLLEHARTKKDTEEEKRKIRRVHWSVLLEQLSLKPDEFIEKNMDARKSLAPGKVKIKAITASFRRMTDRPEEDGH